MKLKSVHVKEFKSVWDSNEFETGKITCLVGKNEAGKTSILQALYRLNPIVEGDGVFDVTHDYPRSDVENYQQDIETRQRTPAEVISATFLLEDDELSAIEEEYGPAILTKPEVVVSKGYAKTPEGKSAMFYVNLPLNESAVVKNLINSFELPETLKTQAASAITVGRLLSYLNAASKKAEEDVAAAQAVAAKIEDPAEKATAAEKAKMLAEGEPAKALRTRTAELAQHKTLGIHIWQTLLRPSFPKFLYFDEYYQMRGHDNIPALKQRKTDNKLTPPDHPLLGLIELARLDLDALINPSRTQDLKNKLQGASNHLSGQILKYWSQNKHLRMQFDVRPGLREDPEGMREGVNIWGEVYDSKHLVSTGLGTRSRGFVWFFSFLAWYSAVKRKNQPLVLLLDEPGLSLHGKAQADLLRYFETEIATNPKHQLIYSTHSPFMVDSLHFDRIRIVQDKGIDTDGPLPAKRMEPRFSPMFWKRDLIAFSPFKGL